MKRRNFITKSALGTFTALLGTEIVFGSTMPRDYNPLALQDPDPFKLFNKDNGMSVLNTKPWNIEATAHLLDDRVTPNSVMFIRNNGLIPENVDPNTWTLTFDGESVESNKVYTLAELKSKFKQYTYQLTLECGGNGRSEFNPPAKGNQWTIGAVASAEWTGIRLRDLLNDVGIKNDAVYIGYHAADTHLSRNPDKEPISRGVPIAKALQEETLIAFKMNGKDIPLAHGFPLRLIAGGWPASASGKWLNRISVRNKVHDGAKMTGTSSSWGKGSRRRYVYYRIDACKILDYLPKIWRNSQRRTAPEYKRTCLGRRIRSFQNGIFYRFWSQLEKLHSGKTCQSSSLATCFCDNFEFPEKGVL